MAAATERERERHSPSPPPPQMHFLSSRRRFFFCVRRRRWRWRRGRKPDLAKDSAPSVASFDCQGPQRTKLHILRAFERTNERARWRFPNVPLSPAPSVLPLDRRRGAARLTERERERNAMPPSSSINAASFLSIFGRVCHSMAHRLVGTCALSSV